MESSCLRKTWRYRCQRTRRDRVPRQSQGTMEVRSRGQQNLSVRLHVNGSITTTHPRMRRQALVTCPSPYTRRQHSSARCWKHRESRRSAGANTLVLETANQKRSARKWLSRSRHRWLVYGGWCVYRCNKATLRIYYGYLGVVDGLTKLSRDGKRCLQYFA